MFTMKLHSLLLVPTLMALAINGEVSITPPGPFLVEDMKGNVYFLCFASVDGTPTELQMKWFDDDGQQITASTGSMFISDEGDSLGLRFTSPVVSQAGFYRCEANVNGTIQSDTVQLKVYKPIVFTSQPEQAIVNGTDAKVWCRFHKVQGDKRIKWFLLEGNSNWNPIVSGGRYITAYSTEAGNEGNYLMIRQAQLSDTATYVCSVDLIEFGHGNSLRINVIVTVPPQFFEPFMLSPITPKEGDRLILSCKAEGIPRPRYIFFKGSNPLTDEQDGEFIIDNLQRTDEGEYMCRAKNAGGMEDESVYVDVRVPPMIESRDNMTTREGSEVKLPCVAIGDPVPDMFWRKKGAQVDYLYSSDQPIYVEEDTDNTIQDGATELTRRTLYLMIPSVQYQHAADYVCKADNKFGVQERTFHIEVTYKPNFLDQPDEAFYGWPGSKTNITCIANGNPEPVITWFKEDKDLSSEPGYTIVNGESRSRTQAISYLFPEVRTDNIGQVIGAYRCQARNKFDTSSQTLNFQQAVAPGQPSLNVIETSAQKMKLRIGPPENNGGQHVLKYRIKYGPAGGSQDHLERDENRFPGDESTEVTLEDLIPNTQYSIKVSAINNVGVGDEKKVVESTEDYSKPDPVLITSSREGLVAYEYLLEWEIPDNGGAQISNYNINFTEATEVDTITWVAKRTSPKERSEVVKGESSQSVMLRGLKMETYYEVKITAVNRINRSDVTKFIFKTGKGAGQTSVGHTIMRASTAMVGLVVMTTVYFSSLQC